MPVGDIVHSTSASCPTACTRSHDDRHRQGRRGRDRDVHRHRRRQARRDGRARHRHRVGRRRPSCDFGVKLDTGESDAVDLITQVPQVQRRARRAVPVAHPHRRGRGSGRVPARSTTVLAHRRRTAARPLDRRSRRPTRARSSARTSCGGHDRPQWARVVAWKSSPVAQREHAEPGVERDRHRQGHDGARHAVGDRCSATSSTVPTSRPTSVPAAARGSRSSPRTRPTRRSRFSRGATRMAHGRAAAALAPSTFR